MTHVWQTTKDPFQKETLHAYVMYITCAVCLSPEHVIVVAFLNWFVSVVGRGVLDNISEHI